MSKPHGDRCCSAERRGEKEGGTANNEEEMELKPNPITGSVSPYEWHTLHTHTHTRVSPCAFYFTHTLQRFCEWSDTALSERHNESFK